LEKSIIAVKYNYFKERCKKLKGRKKLG